MAVRGSGARGCAGGSLDASSFHSCRTACYQFHVKTLAVVQITSLDSSSAAEYTEEDRTVEGFSVWHNAFCNWHLDVVATVLWVL